MSSSLVDVVIYPVSLLWNDTPNAAYLKYKFLLGSAAAAVVSFFFLSMEVSRE